MQKAKAAQMTNDAIDRAIKRGTGEGDAGTYEAIMYEGYAPGGVALLIDVLTDNRNRTGAEVRGVFNKLGGSLAEPGSVSWQFTRRGVIEIDGSADEDDLMLAAIEAGADDVARDGDTWTVTHRTVDGVRGPPGTRRRRVHGRLGRHAVGVGEPRAGVGGRAGPHGVAHRRGARRQ